MTSPSTTEESKRLYEKVSTQLLKSSFPRTSRGSIPPKTLFTKSYQRLVVLLGFHPAWVRKANLRISVNPDRPLAAALLETLKTPLSAGLPLATIPDSFSKGSYVVYDEKASTHRDFVQVFDTFYLRAHDLQNTTLNSKIIDLPHPDYPDSAVPTPTWIITGGF